jgi:hypothetical protein
VSLYLPERCLVPQSDATNAYDLLLDVIACVEAEPRRLVMPEWICLISNIWPPKYAAPACGTVGCVGGWTEMLVRDRTRSGWQISARSLLGARENRELSTDLELLFFDEFPPEELQGTPEYVAHVVARIRAFMAKHEAFLRVKAVRP